MFLFTSSNISSPSRPHVFLLTATIIAARLHRTLAMTTGAATTAETTEVTQGSRMTENWRVLCRMRRDACRLIYSPQTPPLIPQPLFLFISRSLQPPPAATTTDAITARPHRETQAGGATAGTKEAAMTEGM